MPDDVARPAAAVRALDGVDAELQVAPAVDDLRFDDLLLERVVAERSAAGTGIAGSVIGSSREKETAGPPQSAGRPSDGRARVRPPELPSLSPVSRLNRCSLSTGRRSWTVSPGWTLWAESTIATISSPWTVTWRSSSLPRYSTTSAVPVDRADGGADLAHQEVLRPEAREDPRPGALEALGIPRRNREGEATLDQVAGADRHLDEVHRRAADEARDEPVRRVVVEVLRGADLPQEAVAHDRDPLAHRHCLDLVVGDVDHRGPEALVDACDLGAGLDAKLGVQVGERLVHEEHGGLAHDRPAERDALALAAGELLGLAVQQLLQLEDARGVVDALVDVGLGHLAQLEAEREVVADRHVRVERVALEDHGDVAILRGDVVDDPVADQELALGDLLEPGDHPQARGLPATGGADEHHELAVADLEVEVRHGGHVAVLLEHVIKGHGCHEETSVPA